jgi:hypothetical protein
MHLQYVDTDCDTDRYFLSLLLDPFYTGSLYYPTSPLNCFIEIDHIISQTFDILSHWLSPSLRQCNIPNTNSDSNCSLLYFSWTSAFFSSADLNDVLTENVVTVVFVLSHCILYIEIYFGVTSLLNFRFLSNIYLQWSFARQLPVKATE